MGNLNLTPRDVNILLMIHYYDGVGIAHLAKRHFASEKAAQIRLRKLTHAGYVAPKRLKGFVTIGSGPYIYYLGTNGRGHLAERLGSSPRQMHSPKMPFHPEHHFGICSFRVELENSAESRGVVVDPEEWVTERGLREQKGRPIADGEFILRKGEWSRGYRLEEDRGTEAKNKIKSKLSEHMKAYDGRPVLWVVPNERRVHHLLEWAKEVGEANHLDPTIHCVTVQGNDPLAKVWRVPGSQEVYALVPS